MATRARSLRASLVWALIGLGLLWFGAGVAGASTCGDRVIADWSDGRIDGVYQLRCYDDAVKGLPEDVRVYSSAVEDISRALQARVHSVAGREAGGEIGSSAVPTPAASRAAEPPLAVLVLVASVGLLAAAAAATWVVRARRQR